MAKGENRYLATAEVVFIYDHHGELPWDKIEDEMKKTFSDEERLEIHKCTEECSWEYCWFEGGASVRETDQLRDSILEHATALCEIAERYRPFGGGDTKNRDDKVLSALTILYGESPFFLREELHKTAVAAQRLVAGLSVAPSDPPKTTPRVSKVVGLEAFIAEALNGAKGKPSRHKDKITQKPSVEYQRWGIPIGPQSKVFRAFLNTILTNSKKSEYENWTEFSIDQIRTAFAEGYERAIGQFEKAFDRAQDTGD
ncbi:hypothetical protein HGD85_02840 [Rhodobacteraceae bacterium R_SAG10]|jgi:hypothetical protein|nr:hypothetical protein [Rhodobacteraceae bacterium R_SAG10]